MRLRQGICDVVVRVYFTYLHISSIYDLSDEMEAPKNVFGSLMRSGFLCLRNGSIVVTIEIYSIRISNCVLLRTLQLTAPPLRQNTTPNCDRELSLSI
ncbi:hypothetical protein V6N12_034478 [Hibiscus sabdariffa]|uniref:Uncharacterized protein n=1 Tax=Hibiscus sabdariffa TaxID=183260 RepID=A0ABR2DH98_9ROSI